MSWTCRRKKSGQSNNVRVSYGPLKDVYKWNGQNQFFLNNSKSIEIWILRKKQKVFSSKFCMCVPNLVKIDRELMELFANNYFRSASWKKMVKYDNWCIDRSLCDKSTKIGTNDR